MKAFGQFSKNVIPYLNCYNLLFHFIISILLRNCPEILDHYRCYFISYGNIFRKERQSVIYDMNCLWIPKNKTSGSEQFIFCKNCKFAVLNRMSEIIIANIKYFCHLFFKRFRQNDDIIFCREWSFLGDTGFFLFFSGKWF